MKVSILNLSLATFLSIVFIAVNVFNTGQRPSQFRAWDGKKVILDGQIVSDPQRYKIYQRRFEVQPYGSKQKILVGTFNRNNFFYGDKVYIIGKFKLPTNFADYDYIGYLQAKGIFGQISAADVFIIQRGKANQFVHASLSLKHWIYKKFQARLSEEQSALLIALVIGQKDLMSPQLSEAFSKAGVAHLIAVSGYILTLILVFAERFRTIIGKKTTVVLCITIAAVYIVISGFAAGVMRAALMSGIYLFARFNNRQYNSLSSLLFAAALIVALNPLIIANDIGFALSFSSLLGIILLAPLLQPSVEQKYLKAALIIITVTLAAQIATAPITAYYFKEFSVIAPLANLLIIPLITPILAIAYFLCLPILAVPAASLIKLFLNYIITVVYRLAAIPHSSAEVHISAAALIVIYIAELGLYVLLLNRRKRSVKITK